MPNTNEELNTQIFSGMLRDGCYANADLQRQAFAIWMKSGNPRRYVALAAEMNRISPTATTYPFHRCADALVQKLRKAGLAEVKAAKWSLTEAGKSFHAHVATATEHRAEG